LAPSWLERVKLPWRRNLAGLEPYQDQPQGLSRSFQNHQHLSGDGSVFENVPVARCCVRRAPINTGFWKSVKNRSRDPDRWARTASRPDPKPAVTRNPASGHPVYAEQRALEIGSPSAGGADVIHAGNEQRRDEQHGNRTIYHRPDPQGGPAGNKTLIMVELNMSGGLWTGRPDLGAGVRRNPIRTWKTRRPLRADCPRTKKPIWAPHWKQNTNDARSHGYARPSTAILTSFRGEPEKVKRGARSSPLWGATGSGQQSTHLPRPNQWARSNQKDPVKFAGQEIGGKKALQMQYGEWPLWCPKTATSSAGLTKTRQKPDAGS